jgi:hypothetical protein
MSDSTTSGGVGFSGLLQVSFIVLKLCKVISWSWWWVLSPTWIGVSLVILILLGIGVVWLWADRNEARMRRKRIQTMEEYKKQIDDLRQSRWHDRLRQISEQHKPKL